MMDIQADLIVSRVNDIDAGEKSSITATLHGSEVIVIKNYDNGYDLKEIVEYTTTVKCTNKAILKALGIEKSGGHKILKLQDRDSTLQTYFGDKPSIVATIQPANEPDT